MWCRLPSTGVSGEGADVTAQGKRLKAGGARRGGAARGDVHCTRATVASCYLNMPKSFSGTLYISQITVKCVLQLKIKLHG